MASILPRKGGRIDHQGHPLAQRCSDAHGPEESSDLSGAFADTPESQACIVEGEPLYSRCTAVVQPSYSGGHWRCLTFSTIYRERPHLALRYRTPEEVCRSVRTTAAGPLLGVESILSSNWNPDQSVYMCQRYRLCPKSGSWWMPGVLAPVPSRPTRSPAVGSRVLPGRVTPSALRLWAWFLVQRLVTWRTVTPALSLRRGDWGVPAHVVSSLLRAVGFATGGRLSGQS